MCSNRLLVQAAVYDEFAQKLSARVAAMGVGPGAEEGHLQGPLINRDALLKVDAHVQDALSGGAALLTGGKVRRPPRLPRAVPCRPPCRAVPFSAVRDQQPPPTRPHVGTHAITRVRA